MVMFERIHSSQGAPLVVFDGEILHEYRGLSRSMLCVGKVGSVTIAGGLVEGPLRQRWAILDKTEG